MPRTLTTLLAKYPPEVRTLALITRDFILAVLPGAEESVDPSGPVVGYGFGSGYKGLVCTIMLSKSGVKLGVIRGAELQDPDALLEGKGTVHRYVELRGPADLEQPALKELLKTAHAAWLARQ